jgi:DNA-binding MarR family transcriptional regulator
MNGFQRECRLAVVDRDEELFQIDAALERVARACYSRTLREKTQARAGVPVPANAIFALSAVVRHGPLRLGELADRLELQQSRASKEVRRLVEAGLVQQSPDPHDRRATVVAATEDGIMACKRWRVANLEMLGERLGSWNDRDLQSLRRNLARLATNVS